MDALHPLLQKAYDPDRFGRLARDVVSDMERHLREAQSRQTERSMPWTPPEEERAFWREAVLGRRNDDADFAHAVELVRSSRAVDDTLARARHYGQRAIDAIGGFPASAAKEAMIEAVEFAVARAY